MADKKIAGQLVMKLFHARTNAHILHLRTGSYAQHVALADFYEEILDLADTFAESFQGQHGLLECEGKFVQYDAPITMLTELRTWIAENRSKIGGANDSDLLNLTDEMITCINQTLYKLRFLV